MNVLAVNCGSSSIKWALLAVSLNGEPGDGVRHASGRIERLGDQAQVHFEASEAEHLDTTLAVPDHESGVRRIAEWIDTLDLPVECGGTPGRARWLTVSRAHGAGRRGHRGDP